MRNFLYTILIFCFLQPLFFSCTDDTHDEEESFEYPTGEKFQKPISLKKLEGKFLMPIGEYHFGDITYYDKDNYDHRTFWYTIKDSCVEKESISTWELSLEEYKRYTPYGYSYYDDNTIYGELTYGGKWCSGWHCDLMRAYEYCGYIFFDSGTWSDDDKFYSEDEEIKNIDITSFGKKKWNGSGSFYIFKIIDESVTITFFSPDTTDEEIFGYEVPDGILIQLPSFNYITSDEDESKGKDYVFKGWSKSQSLDTVDYEKAVTKNIIAASENTSLYAVWEYPKTYRITFYGNGSHFYDLSNNMEVLSFSEEVTQRGVNGKYSSSFQGLRNSVMRVISRDGYKFTGWSKDPESKNIDIIDGGSMYFTDDVSLYAVWASEKKIIITFDPNGGNSESTTQEVTTYIPSLNPTETYLRSIASLKLSRRGYRFRGWALSRNEKDVVYEDQSNLTISDNITLYALWDKEITYTITFNKNASDATIETDAQSITGTELTGVHGKIANADTLGIKRSYGTGNYILLGWAAVSSASGYEDIEYTSDEEVELTKDITLYAIWLLPEYTVLFKNNGSIVSEVLVKGYGSEISCPAKPSKTGYTFNGWSNGTALFDAGQKIAIYGNEVLSADWTKNSYFIRLYWPGSSSGEKLSTMSYALLETTGYTSVASAWTFNTKSPTYSPTMEITGQSKSITCSISYSDVKENQLSSHNTTATLNFAYGKTYTINVVTGNVSIQ